MKPKLIQNTSQRIVPLCIKSENVNYDNQNKYNNGELFSFFLFVRLTYLFIKTQRHSPTRIAL